MLLIIEAFLLLSAALEGKSYQLDMAENSVDDQYDGCKEKMENLEKHLENEMVNFKPDYQEAEKDAKKPEDNLKRIHSVAIYMYTNKESKVYTELNNAVRSDKQKYKEGEFKWYSIHFLLTDAIQTLKKTCYTTFRGTKSEIQFPKEVFRFGSFTSSSLNLGEAKKFGTKSCLEIYTCEGANVIKYSKYPKEEEVLIPPYETFKVADVLAKTDHKDLWCDTVYKVKSTGKISSLNCAGRKE